MRLGRIQFQQVRHPGAGRRVPASRYRRRPEKTPFHRRAEHFPQDGTTHAGRRIQILLPERPDRSPLGRSRYAGHPGSVASPARPLPRRPEKRHRFSGRIFVPRPKRRLCRTYRIQRQGSRSVQFRQAQRQVRVGSVPNGTELLLVDDERRFPAVYEKSHHGDPPAGHQWQITEPATNKRNPLRIPAAFSRKRFADKE